MANDVLRYYTGRPRQEIISLVTVNFTQPLLRGFGRNSPTVEALTQDLQVLGAGDAHRRVEILLESETGHSPGVDAVL